MGPFAIPSREPARLTALCSYAILDTIAERAYDDLTRLAAYVAQTPIALISFVDRDRQWFKACFGLAASETPREQSFCAHAIFNPSENFIVQDTQLDERFSSNLLVTSDPKIRFNFGVPLLTPDRHALGTLCVIDRVPRTLDPAQIEALETLSNQAMILLELRRYSRDQFKAAGLRATESLSPRLESNAHDPDVEGANCL